MPGVDEALSSLSLSLSLSLSVLPWPPTGPPPGAGDPRGVAICSEWWMMCAAIAEWLLCAIAKALTRVAMWHECRQSTGERTRLLASMSRICVWIACAD
eukprot:1672466-Rhodomonas_salina.1